MNNVKKQKPKAVTKPFLKGKPTDENTFKNALKLLGLILMIFFMGRKGIAYGLFMQALWTYETAEFCMRRLRQLDSSAWHPKQKRQMDMQEFPIVLLK